LGIHQAHINSTILPAWGFWNFQRAQWIRL